MRRGNNDPSREKETIFQNSQELDVGSAALKNKNVFHFQNFSSIQLFSPSLLFAGTFLFLRKN